MEEESVGGNFNRMRQQAQGQLKKVEDKEDKTKMLQVMSITKK